MRKLPIQFIKTAKQCGIEHALKSKGHFYVEKNRVLSDFAPRGIKMSARETKNGVEAEVVIAAGIKIKEPLFFCFGLLDKKYEQFITPNITLEENSSARVIAHCSFPAARQIKHEMEAVFKVKKNARFVYEEYHYHGLNSGASVYPKLKIILAEGAEMENKFYLTKGTVGKTQIEVEARLGQNAKIIIETKVLGRGKDDDVKILDKVYLEGTGSRSLIKMRAAAKDGGRVSMRGETFASAADAQGHVDCQEIVVGKNSIARAVPIVEVSNDQARVTHEASVGKINQKELETLMTRGLSEDEATELIVEAMMR